MADPIGPVTDDFIDGIIKASNAYDPNLNLTQGIQLRALVKQLRDYLLQEIGDVDVAGLTDILYADLITAITACTLIPGSFYRITDFQTVHNIVGVTPVVVHTGPVEPLIVLALANNEIARESWSQAYPQDLLVYTTDNSTIPGATKGCILERLDTIQNVRVCNDFRNAVYRRYKAAPVAFNAASAYAQYAAVQGADGGLYYLSKIGGFAAGAATVPSLTNDDWVQVFPNNNYYYSRSTLPLQILITSNYQPSYTNPAFPVNANDFIDVPLFQNYGTGYKNIEIQDQLGKMINLVFFNDNQALIARNLIIKQFDLEDSLVYPFHTTIVLSGGGFINGVTFDRGIGYSTLVATGEISDWRIPNTSLYATINVTSLTEASFTPYYGVTRGNIYEVYGQTLEFTVTPMSFKQISFPSGMGNLKFNTTAYAQGWNIINGLGLSRLSAGTFQSSAPDVIVDVPMSWRTFIGYPDITTSSTTHQSSADLQKQINMAKTRHIVYAYEQPSFKSVIDISSGEPRAVVWQTELTDVNLSTPSGVDNSEKRLMTFFTSHGNDFQVQQKDLVNGIWTPNYSPIYTIDSVDANNNVTQVTFTPNTAAGVTETRFIIV